LSRQEEAEQREQRQRVELEATEHGGCQQAVGTPRAVKPFREQKPDAFDKKTQALGLEDLEAPDVWGVYAETGWLALFLRASAGPRLEGLGGNWYGYSHAYGLHLLCICFCPHNVTEDDTLPRVKNR